MGVKLVSSAGGSVELVSPTTASNVQVTVPATADTLATQSYASNMAQFRNRIINGLMMINQRGVPASGLNFVNYFVDRWNTQVSNTGATVGYTAGQSSPSAVSQYSNNDIYIQTSTAKPSLSSTDYGFLCQYIEGFNVVDFKLGTSAAKSFTLSFRARASTNLTASVFFQNQSGTRSYVTTVALTTTPTNYVITAPGDTTGTWASDNNPGLVVGFVFAASTSGAYATATQNTWLAGRYYNATTQSNGFATNSVFMNIADVQLEVGTVATPFEVRSYGTEMLLCQRYYEIVSGGRMTGVLYTPNGDCRAVMPMAVPKRATPTLTQSGSLNVIAFGDTSAITNTDLGSITLGLMGANIAITGAGNYAAFAGCGSMVSWADNGSGNFTVYASAE